MVIWVLCLIKTIISGAEYDGYYTASLYLGYKYGVKLVQWISSHLLADQATWFWFLLTQWQLNHGSQKKSSQGSSTLKEK